MLKLFTPHFVIALIKRIAVVASFFSSLEAITLGQPGNVLVPEPKGTGYVLFAPGSSTNTYLIDKSGTVVHTWVGQNPPGYAVYLMPNGDLLRAERIAKDLTCGFPGGRIVLYEPNGNVVWSYVLNSPQSHQSHDIYPMPNGNVLVDVWEWITPPEAFAAGRTISTNGFWSGKVVELHPDVTTKTAIEVWSWRFWDHTDSSGTNATTLNVNFLGTPLPNCSDSDWIHLNAVTYNQTLDQIILSSRNLNEIYIIEHTTNTALSAGHSGGKYGKGGDFLYRWGNPQAYGRGGASDQQLFGQHSPYWIRENSNQVMINNDGYNSGGPCTTSANIINLPGRGGIYELPPKAPFGPVKPSYFYAAPQSLCSCLEGSARRLANGNTMICATYPAGAAQSIFYEVHGTNIVWEYQLAEGTVSPGD